MNEKSARRESRLQSTTTTTTTTTRTVDRIGRTGARDASIEDAAAVAPSVAVDQ